MVGPGNLWPHAAWLKKAGYVINQPTEKAAAQLKLQVIATRSEEEGKVGAVAVRHVQTQT